MPNENAPVCGCGVVVDLPKSRNGALSSRRLTIRIPKSKGGKSDGRAGKKQQDEQKFGNGKLQFGDGASETGYEKQQTREAFESLEEDPKRGQGGVALHLHR